MWGALWRTSPGMCSGSRSAQLVLASFEHSPSSPRTLRRTSAFRLAAAIRISLLSVAIRDATSSAYIRSLYAASGFQKGRRKKRRRMNRVEKKEKERKRKKKKEKERKREKKKEKERQKKKKAGRASKKAENAGFAGDFVAVSFPSPSDSRQDLRGNCGRFGVGYTTFRCRKGFRPKTGFSEAICPLGPMFWRRSAR